MSLALFICAVAGTAAVEDPPNFEEHVQPILREYCLSCHRGSRARNGLELSTVPKILAGGSSGASVVPGDPDGSLLMQVVDHTQGPFMPPDDDRLPEVERRTIRDWIAGGARVDAKDPGSAPERTETVVLPVASAGEATMPEAGLSREPFTWTDRPGAVTALAASPGAPLVAIGGLGQISLYSLPAQGDDGSELLAILPFPEGRPERLAFASSGGVLLAAGGRPGERGVAAGYDVRSGERLFTVGDEPETVLDADITGDLAVVVLGGPDRILRAYDPSIGALRWESKAHTDWVTAVAVSPGGALVASGDRAGGLVVLETFTGREFHRFDPSRGAITGIAWRADGARLATVDEAGAVRVFDAEGGGQVARWSAHNGALDVAWLPDGGVVTVGRDGGVRITDGAGKARKRSTKLEGPTVGVATSADGRWAIAGDLRGRAHVLAAGESDGAWEVLAYPEPLQLVELREAQRALEQDGREHAAAEAEVERIDALVAASESSLDDAAAALQAASARSEEAQAQLASAELLRDAARACLAPLEAARAAASAFDERGGTESASPQWDALLAATREEIERSEAVVASAEEVLESRRSEVAAGEASIEATTSERDALLRERSDAQAALDARAEARGTLESRAAELRERWSAELNASGTWRRVPETR